MSNRIAKIKDLVAFLQKFDQDLDVVFEDYQWGSEPVLISDFNQEDAWLGHFPSTRRFQGVDYTTETRPCFLL